MASDPTLDVKALMPWRVSIEVGRRAARVDGGDPRDAFQVGYNPQWLDLPAGSGILPVHPPSFAVKAVGAVISEKGCPEGVVDAEDSRLPGSYREKGKYNLRRAVTGVLLDAATHLLDSAMSGERSQPLQVPEPPVMDVLRAARSAGLLRGPAWGVTAVSATLNLIEDGPVLSSMWMLFRIQADGGDMHIDVAPWTPEDSQIASLPAVHLDAIAATADALNTLFARSIKNELGRVLGTTIP